MLQHILFIFSAQVFLIFLKAKHQQNRILCTNEFSLTARSVLKLRKRKADAQPKRVYKRRPCPIAGCLSVPLRIHDHLKGKHKLKGAYYSEALASANAGRFNEYVDGSDKSSESHEEHQSDQSENSDDEEEVELIRRI